MNILTRSFLCSGVRERYERLAPGTNRLVIAHCDAYFVRHGTMSEEGTRQARIDRECARRARG